MAYVFRFLAAIGWTVVHAYLYAGLHRAFAPGVVHGDSVWLAWLFGWGLATAAILAFTTLALPFGLMVAAPLLNAGLDPGHEEFLAHWSPELARFEFRHDPLGFLRGIATALAKVAGALVLLAALTVGGAALAWSASQSFAVALVALVTTFAGASACLYPQTVRWWAIYG